MIHDHTTALRRRRRRLRAVFSAFTAAVAVLFMDYATTAPDTDPTVAMTSTAALVRLHDTRSGSELSAGDTLVVAVPGVRSDEPVALNVTALNAPVDGHLAAFTCGDPIEWEFEYAPAPSIAPVLVVVTPDPEGHVCFASTQPTDLVVDHVASLS